MVSSALRLVTDISNTFRYKDEQLDDSYVGHIGDGM